MQPTQVSQVDRPTDVEPVIQHVVPWRVVAVSVLSDFHLQVTFVDGIRGEVDLCSFLNHSDITGTVFERYATRPSLLRPK
ncbi:MAG: DUF2442 domain-containing protein [Nitrospira sp.]|nr:DUF2442 domain-containing protein [Nitrospira sp.]